MTDYTVTTGRRIKPVHPKWVALALLLLAVDCFTMLPAKHEHKPVGALVQVSAPDAAFDRAVAAYRTEQLKRNRCTQIAAMLKSHPAYPADADLKLAAKANGCR